MFEPLCIYCSTDLLQEAVPHIAGLGLGVEVVFDDPVELWPEIQWENLLPLADRIADAGLAARVHGPFHGISLGSRDSHIREYSLKILTASIEAARAFRAPLVVMHTGCLPQFSPKALDKWFEAFCAGLEQLLEHAAAAGIRLAVENTHEEDLSLFERIFNRFPSPQLGMCFDTGHAACFGKIDPVEWPLRFADRICHVHCSDNDGKDDLHWGLGKGVVDLKKLLVPLAAFGGECSVTLEVSAADAHDSRDYLIETIQTLKHEEVP